MYHINGLCPRTDIQMSRCGFCIHLFPEWKEAVAKYNKTQQEINKAISNLHRMWLDGCGFNQIHDPEADPMAAWETKNLGKPVKYSKAAYPLYGEHSIRVTWGEWGPEHITVPGNACGLDLDRGIGAPRGGMSLLPHNVDRIDQAHLLLVVFTWFAERLYLENRIAQQKLST